MAAPIRSTLKLNIPVERCGVDEKRILKLCKQIVANRSLLNDINIEAAVDEDGRETLEIELGSCWLENLLPTIQKAVKLIETEKE